MPEVVYIVMLGPNPRYVTNHRPSVVELEEYRQELEQEGYPFEDNLWIEEVPFRV